jgi:uncharacterized protein (DUF2141 family)
LKDNQGLIKLEVYPSNDADFLGDDTNLLKAGKAFRRVEVRTPSSGRSVQLCVRVPRPAAYSVMVLHDRNSNHKFDKFGDGVGFGGNPKLHWRQPTAAEARVAAGAGLTPITIVMSYWKGFPTLGFKPIG